MVTDVPSLRPSKVHLGALPCPWVPSLVVRTVVGSRRLTRESLCFFPGSLSPAPEEEWAVKEPWEETLQARSALKERL